MKNKIDHLVIGASDLKKGVSFVKEMLGIDMPFGGVHLQMGTHNHLVQLGNDIFLEVIAINPDIDPPQEPRWYGLDDPFVRQQIEKQPTLLTWVVNTQNIKEFVHGASVSFGKPELIHRGELSWYFGIPDDGRLLAGGMLPYVIEWPTDSHPAANMMDAGCRLQRLEIHHPFPGWLQSVLESVNASDLVEVHVLPTNEPPYLIAHIDTPGGLKQLRSSMSEFK